MRVCVKGIVHLVEIGFPVYVQYCGKGILHALAQGGLLPHWENVLHVNAYRW